MTTFNVYRNGAQQGHFLAEDMDEAIERWAATLCTDEEFELDCVSDEISVITETLLDETHVVWQVVEEGYTPLSDADFVERG
jgi:hypothetical protein